MYTKGQHGIYCWGSEKLGQVANRIPEQLREVEVHFVAATDYAFAAVNEHGRVITWGDRRYGGDSRHVQDQLVDVEEIQGTEGAFAAKRKDGQVILWGARHKGGSTRQDRLKEIQTIRSTTTAFAAITQDGHVIAWGDPDKGGDSRYVDDELEDVQEIVGTDAAFAALRKDGHVITWGHDRYGGDTRYIRDQLTNVKSIQATGSAFAAIRKDGSVISWGNPSCGGDTFDVQDQLYDVNFIKGTKVAFAAIRADGTVAGLPERWRKITSCSDSNGMIHSSLIMIPTFCQISLFGSFDFEALWDLKKIAKMKLKSRLFRFFFFFQNQICQHQWITQSWFLRWLPGEMVVMVATPAQLQINWKMYKHFLPRIWPLLQYAQMARS